MSTVSKLDLSPLYEKIKRHIRQLVSSGELAPHERVPSESFLVEQFGVSRMTVHRALRELKEEGVVVRVSGVGTFVADAQPKGHLITVSNIAQEIRDRGHEHSSDVIQNKEESASVEIGFQFSVEARTQLFHSIIVHMENQVPIQLEDRYVLKSIFPDYGDIDFHTVTTNEYLMANAPIQLVEHRVKAVRPSETTQKLLRIDADEPCLLLVRRTWSGDRVVSYSYFTHPASRFEFGDTFKP